MYLSIDYVTVIGNRYYDKSTTHGKNVPVSEKVGISLKSLILVVLMALSSVSPILIESALTGKTETDEKIVSFSNTGANQSSNNSTVDTDGDGITDQDDKCPNGAFGWTSNFK